MYWAPFDVISYSTYLHLNAQERCIICIHMWTLCFSWRLSIFLAHFNVRYLYGFWLEIWLDLQCWEINMCGIHRILQDWSCILSVEVKLASSSAISRVIWPIWGIDTLLTASSHRCCQLLLAVHQLHGLVSRWKGELTSQKLDWDSWQTARARWSTF